MRTTSSNGHIRKTTNRTPHKVRFAVVGAGHIAQNAVLPAFANAKKHCELTAIISGDARKRAALGRLYKGAELLDYDQFDDACRADLFDAVYIALPNHLHRDYTERAAAAGIHVLCEKPMAVTADDCLAMIEACCHTDVRLMIAYRLHFDPANLKAVQIAQGGKLGDLRIFDSVFSMQVHPDNIRLEAEKGGGPLYDIGIYCINAARYLFRDNPTEVQALALNGQDKRFREVEQGVSAIMRFLGERTASFTCSFDAGDVASYRVVGTRGDLVMDPAYEYEGELAMCVTINDKSRETTFAKHDQFAPELIYFARCIQDEVEPEPGGPEGLIDVRIIEAIYESIRTGGKVEVEGLPEERPPRGGQAMRKPPARKKPLVKATPAHA